MKAPTCTGVAEKRTGKIRKRRPELGRIAGEGLFVLVLAVQSMGLQSRAKLSRDGEEFVPVSAVHQHVLVPPAHPVLCKDTVLSMRPRTEEVILDVGVGEKYKGLHGVEWLLCVAKQLDIVKDPLRISSLVRVPHSPPT